MGNGLGDRFDVPPEMRSMAEASVEQARKAFETFLSAAQKAAGAMGEHAPYAKGAKDIGAKAISFAEQNVAASLDYAERLVKASDVTEIMKLHTDYVQGQMRALANQASEMGQVLTQAALDAGKPK